MADYRITWVATGDTIGYLHNITKVTSGADLTFYFDGGNVISEMFTNKIAFVQL